VGLRRLTRRLRSRQRRSCRPSRLLRGLLRRRRRVHHPVGEALSLSAAALSLNAKI